jgi:hypothetical protein
VTAAELSLFERPDSTAPAAPTNFSTDPASPSPSTTPRFKGTADSGTIVRIHTDPFTCTNNSVSASGTAAQFAGAGIAVPVSAGQANYGVTAMDESGNISSGCAGPIDYEQDSVPPDKPILDAIPSPQNTDSITIKGAAEPGSTVKLYGSADCTGPVAATHSASEFSAGFLEAVGNDTTYTLALTATDAAGNVSACSDPRTFVEDSTSGTPTITGTDPPPPANNNAPKLKGSGADADADVYVHRGLTCAGPADFTGPASQFQGAGIPVTVADNTSASFVVEAFDAVGNGSACSSPFTYTEDSIAPAAPMLSATDPGSGADDNSPKLKGGAEAGSAVTVFATSDCTGAPAANGTAAELGGAGIAVSVLDNTTTAFSAKATDPAGNASSCSAPISYSEVTVIPGPGPDLLPPQTTITSAPKATVKTKSKSASYSIAFEANEPATFKCSLDKAPFAPCSSPATGKAKKGSHTFSVVATDSAGNVDPSPATAEWKVKRKKRHH